MMMLKIFILSLILKISLATMPMDYGAAVNILGPTVDKMASSIRTNRSTRPLSISSIAALAYEQSMLLPLLQDCQATIKADRGGLGEFLKTQTKLDDRVFQQRLASLVRMEHDARLSESLESVLEKDYKASEKTERDIDNIMKEFKRIGKERLGVVQKTSDDVGTAAEKALNASAELTYRQRKYLRESSTLQKQAKRAGGPSQEVDDIRDLVSDGAKGTSRWVKETEAENSKKFSDVARKEAEKLKKYISLRSVVSSGIEETNAAKMEWDKTLDAICRPFLTDILSTTALNFFLAITFSAFRTFNKYCHFVFLEIGYVTVVINCSFRNQ